MYKNFKILGIIPARGGSKGIPRKNIIELGGKPLIAWTIEAAKKSLYMDRVILSSEDTEIINIAKQFGCEVPFVRPMELALDETKGIEPVIHAINMLPGYDYIVLLQPTSPLRTTKDIDNCIIKCIDGNFDSCVSVKKVTEHPYIMYEKNENDTIKKFINIKVDRRQEMPDLFILNGAIYIAKTNVILNTKDFITNNTTYYIMPYIHSIDLDTYEDLELLRLILNKTS